MSYSTPGYMPIPPRPFKRPAAATTLAVFGICVAALYLLGAVWGIFVAVTKIQIGPPNSAMEAFMREPAYQAVIWASGLVNLVINGALLMGSIWLLKREKRSVLTLTVYAWSAIVIQGLVMTTVSAVYVMPRSVDVAIAGLREQGKPVPPGFEQTMQAIMLVSVVFQFAFVLAMPIADLVVLRRKSLREWLSADEAVPAG
jgi:hypothetical protein